MRKKLYGTTDLDMVIVYLSRFDGRNMYQELMRFHAQRIINHKNDQCD